uniref:NADH dehydrogenase subunit 4L n=1 Tax=Echinostoma paraensei TaxID=48215 RepID=A0A172GFU1_9TREM|nr:NADH dehydrogenase subunit 4L [Echinostoma paraensei]
MFGGVILFLFLGSLIVLFSFFMSLSRLLNCLIVVENFNVLLLLFCLLGQWDEFRMLFIALIVIFTVEVTLGLVVLTRLWDSSSLIGIVGV